MRINRYLAAAGLGSRRSVETLILEGRVKINGRPVETMATLVAPGDVVKVGSKTVAPQEIVQAVLYKPAGFLCTASDELSRRTIFDLLPTDWPRVYHVGRLDMESEGLLIVTNDGHFSHAVIHPSSNIEKEYLAKTGQEITDTHLKTISKGTFVEGCFVKPISVKKVRKGTLKVIIKEGKKREVRLLLSDAGLDVQYLSRIRIGNLVLGSLPIGSYRELTDKEKDQLLGA